MRRSEARKLVAVYLADRLRTECAKRGKATEIARAIQFTRVHVAAVARGDNAAGEDFFDAMARYWGLTRAQLDEEAATWSATHGVDTRAPRSESLGRLHEHPEWPTALAAARAVFRGIPDEYFERAGMVFHNVSDRVDAQFVGELASVFHGVATRDDAAAPASSVSATAGHAHSLNRKRSKV
jgi:hypothetical protein